MRKTASILLLATVLLAFVCPGIYFPVLKSVHRVKMQEWLHRQPPSHFTKIILTSAETKSLGLPVEKEFEWYGKKYDVISIHAERNITVVYCINDHEEELLFAKASGNAGRSNQLQLIKSLSIFVYLFPQQPAVNSPLSECLVLHNTPYVKNFPEHSFEILSPPPQG